MTTFERLILIAYMLFAWTYMYLTYMSISHNKTWCNVVIDMLISAIFGLISFPMVLAADIWNKLNKEEQR